MTTKELLESDIQLAKGITELTQITDTAISMLARAILELDEGNLRQNTRAALRVLVDKFNDE